MTTHITTEHITDFQHILYFLEENALSTQNINEINFENSWFTCNTESLNHSFNISLPNKEHVNHTIIHWSEIDYLNERLRDKNVTIQILDVIQRHHDEFKTVYYTYATI